MTRGRQQQRRMAKPQPVSTTRMLLRGLVRRCPRCGGGGVFRHWFTMRKRCPTCGVRFDRRPEEAFFLGAFVIQTALILTPVAVLLLGLQLLVEIGASHCEVGRSLISAHQGSGREEEAMKTRALALALMFTASLIGTRRQQRV